ncbi:hypothetical protein PSFL111601_05830 [Pseudomonas floridensis]
MIVPFLWSGKTHYEPAHEKDRPLREVTVIEEEGTWLFSVCQQNRKEGS